MAWLTSTIIGPICRYWQSNIRMGHFTAPFTVLRMLTTLRISFEASVNYQEAFFYGFR